MDQVRVCQYTVKWAEARAPTSLQLNRSGLETGLFLVPGSALFVGIRQSQHGGLAERFSEQLQPYGEPGRLDESAGYADPTNAAKIARNRKNIRKIHLQRIV